MDIPLAPVVVDWFRELRTLAGNSAYVLPAHSRSRAARHGGDTRLNKDTLREAIAPELMAGWIERQNVEGDLLLYPISRFSGHDDGGPQGTREKLFANPDDGQACDLVGLAVSFPVTKKAGPSEAYLEGTARWQPVLG